MKSFKDLKNLTGVAKDVLEGKPLEESFMRLPGHVIGNELYSVKQAFESFYSAQKNGNDFNPKALNDIIKTLQSIKKEAKKFNSPEDVPVSYQYKK